MMMALLAGFLQAQTPLIEGNAKSPVRILIFEDLGCSDCATLRKMLDEHLLPKYKTRAAFEHRDKGRDLLLSSRFGFHIVSTKGQRETVLRTEFREHCLCLGVSIDRDLEIVGDFHVFAALVGARPTSVGFGLIGLS